MFKRLFAKRAGGAPAPVSPLKYEQLNGVPLDQCLALLKRRSEASAAITASEVQDLSRRLIDIVFFDENATVEDRRRAGELEEALWKDMETGLSGDADALAVRCEARTVHIQHGRQLGLHSLASKIQKLDPNEVVSAVVSPDNGPLLGDFPRDLVESNRDAIATGLLCERATRYISERWTKTDAGAVSSLNTANAVITAGTLILNRDPTALWVFTSEERSSLGRFLDDYKRARETLLHVGALDDGFGTDLPLIEFAPETCHDMVLQSCAEDARRNKSAQTDRYRGKLAIFDQETRDSFMTIVFGLRLLIWKRTLCSGYGTSYFERVLSSKPDASWPTTVLPMVSRMEELYLKALSDESKGTGFHNWLVAGFVLDILDGKPAEWRTDQTVQTCAALFDAEIFHFSHYVRFLVRYLALGDSDEVTRSLGEDALERAK